VNLADVLLRSARDAPDAVALVEPPGTTTTFGALADTAARLAGVLLDADVGPGDRVALVAPNSAAFVTGYLAALHAGATCVPLNPTAPPAALERELTVVDATITLAAGLATSLVGAAGHAVLPLDLESLPPTAAPSVERAPDDVAVLLFTSGTASAPRAAILTHTNLAANIAQVLDHPGLAVHPADVGLGALPFFHVFGLNVVLGVGLAAGTRTVLIDRFDAAGCARIVRDHHVSVLLGVPTMFTDWLALNDADAPPDTFASVRLAVSGAAPLPGEVAQAFRARFGVGLDQGYGLTEASPIVTTSALSPDPAPPGSIGRPVPGVEVRLVDTDGADVLVGDPGELWVRGPNVFPGYWRDEAATTLAFGPDRWLRTGDAAVVEDDGGLRLVDRLKDLILVSGFNVYPVEVEDVLRSHPDVRDAGVIGVPSPRTGETVVAYLVVEPDHQPDPSVLMVHCAHALARYKCPTRIEFLDELPRNPAGKLLRRALPTT
jgi:long-chain acyl-CoA synthetase